jgi:hypothetical protein
MDSAPAVAIGERAIYGLSLEDVAAFVGIAAELDERLPPAELVARLELVMVAAERYLRQFPDAHMADLVPSRDRSYCQLGYHVFVIAEAFLTAIQGATLSYESLAVTPPDSVTTGSDVAAYGAEVRGRLGQWSYEDGDAVVIPTYYGEQTLHEVLERTTWHAAQHVRQLMTLLEGLGLAPDGPLTAADLAGLPLPQEIWEG